MVYRTPINYTVEQKSEMWDRWQRGESLNAIGRVFDRPSSSIFGQLAPRGGICPPPRQRSRLALTLLERERVIIRVRGILSNISDNSSDPDLILTRIFLHSMPRARCLVAA
jgi:hypothetical protein